MTAFDSALVRWAKAYTPSHGGGREVFINVQGVKDSETAVKVGQSVVNGVIDVDQVVNWTSILDAGESPLKPGEDWGGALVTGAHYQMDGETVQMTPTLIGEATIHSDATMRRALRTGTGGTLWGTPDYSPPSTGGRVDTTPPEVSFDGEVYPRYSPLWRAPKAWQGSWVDVGVAEAGFADTGFKVGKVFQGGDLDGIVFPLATVVVKAGTKRKIVMMNESWQAGELLVVWCYKHGGSKQATVSLKGTMI